MLICGVLFDLVSYQLTEVFLSSCRSDLGNKTNKKSTETGVPYSLQYTIYKTLLGGLIGIANLKSRCSLNFLLPYCSTSLYMANLSFQLPRLDTLWVSSHSNIQSLGKYYWPSRTWPLLTMATATAWSDVSLFI